MNKKNKPIVKRFEDSQSAIEFIKLNTDKYTKKSFAVLIDTYSECPYCSKMSRLSDHDYCTQCGKKF